jgi:hypothetical protein
VGDKGGEEGQYQGKGYQAKSNRFMVEFFRLPSRSMMRPRNITRVVLSLEGLSFELPSSVTFSQGFTFTFVSIFRPHLSSHFGVRNKILFSPHKMQNFKNRLFAQTDEES